MSYLIDTNILLRLCDKNSPQHLSIRKAINFLKLDNHQLYISFQNCTEFWNVSTRPIDKNGFGLSVTKTANLLKLLEKLFIVIQDDSDIYEYWKKLVIQYEVKGVKVHDARLVAIMKSYQINNILTYNVNDFKRYFSEGITALSPDSILNNT